MVIVQQYDQDYWVNLGYFNNDWSLDNLSTIHNKKIRATTEMYTIYLLYIMSIPNSKIATIDRVCIHYLQMSQGEFLASKWK